MCAIPNQQITSHKTKKTLEFGHSLACGRPTPSNMYTKHTPTHKEEPNTGYTQIFPELKKDNLSRMIRRHNRG